MPRAGDGTYTLPSNTVAPAVAGTIIDASDFNDVLNDLAAEMTDSLSRNGDGGMNVALPFAGGDAAAPGITFVGDLDTGIFSDVANEVGVTAGATEVTRFSATGVAITGDLAVSGSYGLTAADLPAVGQQVSAEMGVFTTSSVTYVDATDGANALTVTITTAGRPVMLIVQPISSGVGGIIISTGAGGFGAGYLQFMRGVSDSVAQFSCTIPVINSQHDFPSMVALDVVGAGTYTYKVQARVANANVAVGAVNLKLVAYEL